MGEDEEDNGALIYRGSQLRKKEAAAAVVAAATASSATGEVPRPRRIRPTITMDAFSFSFSEVTMFTDCCSVGCAVLMCCYHL